VPAGSRHVNRVCENQAAVGQCSVPKKTVVLESNAAKFRPYTVTETEPQPTKFGLPTHDEIGASKLKGLLRVAETPATDMKILVSPPWKLPWMH